MQVKVTVSRPGGKTGNSFSQSITLKDAAAIEEVHEAIDNEFAKLFPVYRKLGETQTKEEKKKGKQET